MFNNIAKRKIILIVDRKLSFVIELIDDTKSTFEKAIGLATSSKSKSTALSYVSIFESLWKQTELYQKLNGLYNGSKSITDAEKFMHSTNHELKSSNQYLDYHKFFFKGNIEQYKELLNVIRSRNAKRL